MARRPVAKTLLAIGLTFAAVSAAQIEFAHSAVRGRSNHVTPPGPEGRFTFEKLQQLIRDEKLETIEQVLPRLPQAVRDRYVLMYRSRSLQKAEPQKPRAIVFEGDTSFILGFNDSSLTGGDKLEVIQFREQDKRWEFREIAFAPGHSPEFSGPNPRKCLECHQSPERADVDPRPNWEPYNIWPGAYGSRDGDPTKPFDKYFIELLRPADAAAGARLVAEQAQEQANLPLFETTVKPTHARYRTLGQFQGPDTLNFTDIVVGTNALRAARLAAQTPDWDVYRPLYIEGIMCNRPRNYAPGAMGRASAGTPSLGSVPVIDRFLPPAFPAEIRAPHEARAQSIIAGRRFFYPDGPEAGPRVSVFFEARGIDTSDWSTDFKTGGRFAFQDRFGTPSEPIEQFRNGLAEALGIHGYESCDDAREETARLLPEWRASGRLQEIAQANLARVAALRLPASPEAAGALLTRCTTCHEGAQRTAPLIPFSNLSALRVALGKTGYARGTLMDEVAFRLHDLASTEEQMPPTGNTRPETRQKLLEYLRGL